MKVKKFYGSTIQDARHNATEKLGKTCIIVETKQAAGGEPAWVHVLDETDAHPNKTGTYSRGNLFPETLSKLKKTVNESFKVFNINDQEKRSYLPPRRFSNYSNASKNSQDTSPKHSENLIKNRDPANREIPFKKEIQALTERFDQLEQLIRNQITETGPRDIAHPAFQQLLASGIPPATITSWFNKLLNQGIDPYGSPAKFSQQLANKVKQVLDIAAGEKLAKVILFTGSSGSGKSSLIMKLALRLALLDEAECALVSVFPAKNENYYSPLDQFASSHNLAHYIVRGVGDLSVMEKERGDFDHFLIEIPSTKWQKMPDGLTVKRFRQFFSTNNSLSLEIHRVVNARVNYLYFNTQDTTDGYSVPYYLDFTHLDEITKKGCLLPIMQQSGCKVRYLTAGPFIPDDISVFVPAHFAKELLAKT